ncbi:hypothetical protein [uncultured Eubacterium sp.]|uniref:hypothetical protein n=1 Tax=uncultured Eubacterium sp. TaxID=165185 RepID=UPI002592C4BC|nr:hypothetical protein [uncultured Eubacterium sp.]
MTKEEKGKTYALHKASEKLHDYYGSAMLGVVQFNGYDIQRAYVDGYLQAEQNLEVKEVDLEKDMQDALRMEYEKGSADVIADTLSWLENCWPKYCSNQTIIEGYKEAIKGE